MPPKRRRRFHGVYYHSSPPKVLPMDGHINNESGKRRRETDEFAVKLSTIRIWMHEKDIGKLTRILWIGQGNRLRQQASTNPKVKRFLAAVPYVMNSIKDIHQAVVDNNLEKLQMQLEPPVPPALITCKDSNGLNVIHKAAGLGHTMILEYLLGIWPDGAHETDITGKTPLHWAASAKNNMRCYGLLTQAGCDEEAVDYRMKTPAYYRHKSNEIERSFLSLIPDAPRVSQDIATDWEALSDECGEGFKKLNVKIPDPMINGLSSSDAMSAKNPLESDLNGGTNVAEDEINNEAEPVHSDEDEHFANGLNSEDTSIQVTPLSSPEKAEPEPASESEPEPEPEPEPDTINPKENEEVKAQLEETEKENENVSNAMNESATPTSNERDDQAHEEQEQTTNEIVTENEDADNATDKEALAIDDDDNDKEPLQEKEQHENENEDENKGAKNGTENEIQATKDIHDTDEEQKVAESGEINVVEEVADNEDIKVPEEKDHSTYNEEKHSEIEKFEEAEGMEKENNENKDEELKKMESPKKSSDGMNDTNDIHSTDMTTNKNDKTDNASDSDEENNDNEEHKSKDSEEDNVAVNNERKKNEKDANAATAVADVVDKNHKKEKYEDTDEDDDDQDFVAQSIDDDSAAASDENNEESAPVKDDDDDKDQPEFDENQNEKKSIDSPTTTTTMAIEGFIQGESEDNQVQSQSAAFIDEEYHTQKIIESVDMEQLAQIVLHGKGEKLLNTQSKDPEIQAFLNNVPAYMSKIRRVHTAAREGSLTQLQSALDRRKFAIAKDRISPNGASPLHVAVIFGHSDIVRYLAGRFPETTTMTDDDGRTPLHYAATIKDNGHFYNLLTHLGANPKALDNLGNTAESYLDAEQSKDILNYRQLLRNFGAEKLEDELLSDQGQAENSNCLQTNPVFKTEQGRYLASTLSDPLIKGLTEIAETRPADPVAFLAGYLQNFVFVRDGNPAHDSPTSSDTNSTALVNSVENPSPEKSNNINHNKTDLITNTIEERLSSPEEYTPKMEDRDEHGQSMLHFACARSHRRNALLNLIQESQIDITYRDELYRTARDVSLQANQPANAKEIDRYILSMVVVGDLKPFEYLAISGYDHIIDVEDDEGESIINVALTRGHEKLVEFLGNMRKLEELREELHQSIRDGELEKIRELTAGLNAKWVIEAKNYYGRTALHIAVLKESEEIVEHLVNVCPESLRIGDNLERTALHYAMGTNAIESVSRILIRNGAKRTTKDLKGRQPTYYFMNKADILRLQEEEEEHR